MDNIVAIIPFYNDFKALQRLLLHLKTVNLPSIFCDGRFHNFQKINDSDFSTDGSRFLIHGFKNSSLIEYGPCHIDEKLNKLFHESAKKKFTYALLLGSDEYPEMNIQELKKNLEELDKLQPLLVKVPFIEHSPKSNKAPIEIERIFQMPGLIRARGTHRSFYSAVDQAKGLKIAMQSYPKIINGITIHHDNSIRTKERNELMQDYQMRIKEMSS